jgi:3-oxoacyl-[acyl-carrier protein] reductase
VNRLRNKIALVTGAGAGLGAQIAADVRAIFENAARTMLESQTPLHSVGDTDDIAWPAVYLASDEAKFVIGQVLSPNGGFVTRQ